MTVQKVNYIKTNNTINTFLEIQFLQKSIKHSMVKQSHKWIRKLIAYFYFLYE